MSNDDGRSPAPATALDASATVRTVNAAARAPEIGRAGAAAVTPRALASAPDEDEDDDVALPPLDDDDGSDDDAPGIDDDAPVSIDVPEAEDDPYDDATADELAVDDVDPVPEDDADDDREIDVGALTDGIDTSDDADPRDDTQGFDASDEDDEDDDDGGEDDGGVEGTSEAIEDEVDEAALPELDADDEGEFEDQDLLAAVGAEDAPLPPWAKARWSVREGAGASVPCACVAVGRGRVVAAGDVLLVVDEGAHAARQSGAARAGVSVAASGDAAYVATRRGAVVVVRGEPSGAAPLPGWRARGALELATTAGRLWVRCDDALWCAASVSDDGPELAPEPVRPRGVRAIAAAGAVALAITTDHGAPSVERRRSDDEGWRAAALRGEAARASLDPTVRLVAAAEGQAIAILGEQRVCVSRDGGASFTVVDLPCAAAAAFAGDAPDAPLLVLIGRPGHEAGYLVEVDRAGDTAVLAAIPGAFPEASEDGPAPGAAGLAWDASRELAWAASGAGLVALGRARRH
jgi:hypothetical protein